MTLVMSLLDNDRAIQFSDRRISSNREPTTEEYNKAALVITRDVRLLMGLSGLATVGQLNPAHHVGERFDLGRTVADGLMEVAAPEYTWGAVSQRLAEHLSEVFSRPPISGLPALDQRCVLHFVGFAGTSPPTPVSTFVSNFHNPHTKELADTTWNGFRTTTAELTDGLMAQAIGTYAHISRDDVAPLSRLMREGRPDEAVVGKGVELLRGWADRLGKDGAIGRQITSSVLPSDMDEWATCRYHSNVVQSEVYGPAEIRIDGPGGYATGGFRMKSTSGPTVGPKLGRNEPCWCNSGKKYKRCHGSQPAGKTLIIEVPRVQANEPPTRDPSQGRG